MPFPQLAEPEAQIGFVGPRVIEQTTEIAPPKDSHSAETLLRNGLIDLVVDRRNLPSIVSYLVRHLKKHKTERKKRPTLRSPSKGQRLPAWQKVCLARHPDRPTTRYYVGRMTTRFLELHGDRWSGDDPAIIGGLAELNGQTVCILGNERGGTPDEKRHPTVEKPFRKDTGSRSA